MSDATSVFRRLGTMGWLVLCGSIPPEPSGSGLNTERLLEVADLSRRPFIITTQTNLDPAMQALIDDIEILLGIEIEGINPSDLTDELLQEIWLHAGIIIISGGSESMWQDLLGARLFRTRPQEIIAEGAVVFAFESAANVMGTWVLDKEMGEVDKGLGWLLGGVVASTNTDPGEIQPLKEHLEEFEGVYALGLPAGSMLALGPRSEIELWTETAPVVLLGRGWQ